MGVRPRKIILDETGGWEIRVEDDRLIIELPRDLLTISMPRKLGNELTDDLEKVLIVFPFGLDDTEKGESECIFPFSTP